MPSYLRPIDPPVEGLDCGHCADPIMATAQVFDGGLQIGGLREYRWTTVKAGQTVWCRTAYGEWWKTTAAGPATWSIGRPQWRAVPVLGWDADDPMHPVNWPAEDVLTVDPSEKST